MYVCMYALYMWHHGKLENVNFQCGVPIDGMRYETSEQALLPWMIKIDCTGCGAHPEVDRDQTGQE